ncbi:hypothetical protein LB505_012061 [Fusarium chuoi]|nr:hypothetical protein LB505_012061 [Fusarium chuoi]
MYALEGSIAVAGSSVKFLVDNFGFIESSAKLSALAETVEDNGGCTFVTAFSGLFAPYWIDDARGTIFGITAAGMLRERRWRRPVSRQRPFSTRWRRTADMR